MKISFSYVLLNYIFCFISIILYVCIILLNGLLIFYECFLYNLVVEKSTYHTLNLFKNDVAGGLLRGRGWVKTESMSTVRVHVFYHYNVFFSIYLMISIVFLQELIILFFNIILSPAPIDCLPYKWLFPHTVWILNFILMMSVLFLRKYVCLLKCACVYLLVGH